MRGGQDHGLGSGSGVAEVLPCRAYRRMVGAEHGGAGGGHTGVVPARLVAVAQFVRDGPQLEGQRQHQRIGMRPTALPGGERLLQHPPGRARIVRLPMQPGQQVSGAEHVRMILAERRPGGLDRIDQQVTGSGEVTGTTQREGPLLSDGQGRGMGHEAHAAGYGHLDATRRRPAATPSQRQPDKPDADVHDPSAACTVTPRAAHRAAHR
ncbi:hypothetical protein Van01_48230 [Micromonospora andamanensis]|uniref:Uncharacterized protein n=1 Tax=Micromonospora andamanensis TaxID=1287068 RepID=A0ABQ4I143_9ACTN|nr:hypothetical protein Van01_48230 [Micromonospora andamanensis]